MYSHLSTHSTRIEHLGCCQLFFLAIVDQIIINISCTQQLFFFCTFFLWMTFLQVLWNIKVIIKKGSIAIQVCEKLTLGL